jgi:class 3 adenylate cyclase/tetratricopeptide (TPR) repeat protein
VAGDLKTWLEGLGLSQYAQTFIDNDVDFEVLPHLSDAEISELGLSLGHRNKLRRAIEELGESSTDSPLPASGVPTQEAERRQLTVLFCDLVGSTELSAKLDPEDMREVLRAYQQACSKVIKRYEGFIAKFMGDGVYAYFGYPTAHEDDAERAINAGLGIVETVSRLENDLTVRIGVATGTVAVGDIVGEGASEEANVVGEAPNLAARLQAIAEPNTVVIGEATHALAGGMFETMDLGAQDLKGFSNQVSAWRVLRAGTSESRFQATRGEQLTELIGRKEELDTLMRRWERAKKGEGQVVLISGEPGIGKSRLAQALQDELIAESHFRLLYQCSPYHTNSAFYPIIEQLERGAGFEPSDSPNVKLDKLEAALANSSKPVKDTAPFIAPLLSIPADDRYPALEFSPQRQKELTLNALEDQLVGLAEQRPVLFVFEDAHWIDPTTLELLEMTVERVPEAAVLMVITYRPEFDAPWVGRPRVTPMMLSRLERRDCALMVEKIAKEFGIAEELRDRIATQTDGVPLFIEELTKSVLERATDAGTTIEVPTTLQDSLEARLDRLGTAKEVAEVGAVIGRTFDYDLVSHVTDMDNSALASALEAIVGASLATVRGAPPNATYTFKHALVQDTAYGSLLRGRRIELHEKIAQFLEARSNEGITAGPEVIGFHYAEAGKDRAAVSYFAEAGKVATDASAMKEALAHYTKALELNERLPEDQAKLETEAELLQAQGLALRVVEGHGSKNALAALERSLKIGKKIGTSGDVQPVIFMMGNTEAAQGKFDDAMKNAEVLFELSRLHGDMGAGFAANFIQGIVRFHIGETIFARDNFREILQCQDQSVQSTFDKYMMEFNVGPRFRGGNCQWILGYPDQALVLAEEAVSWARKSSPVSLASALNFGCFTLVNRGDEKTVEKWSDETLGIAEEHNFGQHQGWSKVFGGWVLVRQGCAEQGLEMMEAGISQFRDSGRRTWLASLLILQADGHLLAGNASKALARANEALLEITAIGESQFESPAKSAMGDAYLALGQPEEAESTFLEAINVARSQEAKSWELRASTRLARLWQSQGKTAEARELLAPIYGWFNEGFDTADLKEAKTLLDEIN